MAEVACEEGVEAATVTKVVARVRLARRTFYDLFADRHDCLRTVVEEAVERATVRVRVAYAGDAPWRERLRSAVFELLCLVDEERDLARLCLSRLYSDDPAFAALRGRLLQALIASVEQGRGATPTEPPPLAAEGALGAAGWVLYTRLLDWPGSSVLELLGPLMSVLVLPFLGPAQARRELESPAPQRMSSSLPGCERPVGERTAVPSREPASFRVTYRTARVLEFIAANPRPSNRAVADASGIKDQGQVSKLLARLERTGLLENAGGAHGANAWQLTPEGRELSRAITASHANRAG